MIANLIDVDFAMRFEEHSIRCGDNSVCVFTGPLPSTVDRRWGDEEFDVFVILGDRAADDELVLSLATQLATARTRWVEVFGKRSESLHDEIDRVSVRIGRQAAVGDGDPMTAWDESDVSIDELAAHIARDGLGSANVKVVLNLDPRLETKLLVERIERQGHATA